MSDMQLKKDTFEKAGYNRAFKTEQASHTHLVWALNDIERQGQASREAARNKSKTITHLMTKQARTVRPTVVQSPPAIFRHGRHRQAPWGDTVGHALACGMRA